MGLLGSSGGGGGTPRIRSAPVSPDSNVSITRGGGMESFPSSVAAGAGAGTGALKIVVAGSKGGGGGFGRVLCTATALVKGKAEAGRGKSSSSGEALQALLSAPSSQLREAGLAPDPYLSSSSGVGRKRARAGSVAEGASWAVAPDALLPLLEGSSSDAGAAAVALVSLARLTTLSAESSPEKEGHALVLEANGGADETQHDILLVTLASAPRLFQVVWGAWRERAGVGWRLTGDEALLLVARRRSLVIPAGAPGRCSRSRSRSRDRDTGDDRKGIQGPFTEAELRAFVNNGGIWDEFFSKGLPVPYTAVPLHGRGCYHGRRCMAHREGRCTLAHPGDPAYLPCGLVCCRWGGACERRHDRYKGCSHNHDVENRTQTVLVGAPAPPRHRRSRSRGRSASPSPSRGAQKQEDGGAEGGGAAGEAKVSFTEEELRAFGRRGHFWERFFSKRLPVPASEGVMGNCIHGAACRNMHYGRCKQAHPGDKGYVPTRLVQCNKGPTCRLNRYKTCSFYHEGVTVDWDACGVPEPPKAYSSRPFYHSEWAKK